MNFMGMSGDGVAANGDGVKADGDGEGKLLWGWADVHYRVTLYSIQAEVKTTIRL